MTCQRMRNVVVAHHSFISVPRSRESDGLLMRGRTK